MGKVKKLPEPEEGPLLIGYARVSTDDQNLDLQIDALRKAGVPDGHIHSEYVSGAGKHRPALELAIKDLRPGDTLVVWRLDRLARSMRDLYHRLDQINEAEASFRSLTENFDFTTAFGKLYLAIAGAFAEFERQIISYRTTAGMQSLKAKGHMLGRAREFTDAKQARAIKLVRAGIPIERACKAVGVSKATFYGYYRVTRKGRRVTVTKRKK